MFTKVDGSGPSLASNPTRRPQKSLNNNDQSIKVENDMDRIRDFKLYFPYNNSLKVIRIINKKVALMASRKFIKYPEEENNSIKELLEVNRNYSQGLFVKHKRLDKTKFTVKEKKAN